MKKARSLILVPTLLSVFVGSAYAGSAKDAILAADAKFVQAYNAKDAATVATIYSEDAAALPTNDYRADGRTAIQKLWQGGIDFGFTALTFNTQEVQEAGDWAYAIGVYTAKYPDKTGKMIDDVGKFVEIWKKGADGQWYLHRDIWNDDPPKPQ